MITSPITRPITSRIASAIAGARVGGVSYDYYVDSVNGNDANDGTTASAPFETIAAAVTAGGASTDGLKIGLARGSHWRESLVLTGDNVTVAAYGSGTMPILDAGDVASTFSKTGGQTNVYQIDWAAEDTPAYGKSNITVLEHDGTDITKLIRVYTLGDCDTTPGSWYASYSANIVGSTQTVYIHTSGSDDPDANGLTYTIPSRHYGLKVGDGCVADGVRTRQNLNNDGSLVAGLSANVKNCLAEYGHIHNALVASGSVYNCTFWETCMVSATGGSHSMLVGYVNDATGLSLSVKKCVFASAAVQGTNHVLGFYSHTQSSATPYTSITLMDNVFTNVNTCSGVGNAPLSYRDYRTRAYNISYVTSGDALDSEIYDTYVSDVNGTGPRLFQLQAVFDGLRIHAPVKFSGSAFGLSFLEGSEIKNSIFVGSRSAPDTDLAYDTTANARIKINNCIFDSLRFVIYTSNAAAEYEGDNNVFYNVYAWVYRNTTITTLASFQSTTSQDANSVTTDPDLADPANGDFTPQAEGLPTVGLLRPNITYTEVPSKAAIEAM